MKIFALALTSLSGACLVACGAPVTQAPHPTGVPVTIVDPEPTAAEPRCDFELDEGSRALSVRPQNLDQSFTVDVERGAVVARLAEEWTRLDGEARGALEFQGTMAFDDIDFEVVSALESELARVAEGAELLGLRYDSGRNEAAVKLGDTNMDLYVGLRPVPFLCGDIVRQQSDDSAEGAENGAEDEVLGARLEGQEPVITTEELITVRAEPNGGDSLLLRRFGLFIPLYRSDESNGWSRVHWRWTDGSGFEGWMESVFLRDPTADERAQIECSQGNCGALGRNRIGDNFGYGGLGLRGTGGGGSYYVGPARVSPGTPVYAEEGTAPWATVRENEGYQVRWLRGTRWVYVTQVPGMSIHYPGQVIVERSKVELLEEE